MEIVEIYFINFNNLAVITVPIFLHFFCFYLTSFPSWIRICIQHADPDPGAKNVNECEFMRIRIHSPEQDMVPDLALSSTVLGSGFDPKGH